MGSRRCRPGCRWRGRLSRPDGVSIRSAAQHTATLTHAAANTATVDTTAVDDATTHVAAIDAALAASVTLTINLTVASSDRLPVLPARMA